MELTHSICDSGGQAVALVADESDLSAYAAWLIGGEYPLIDLTECAVAAVSFDAQAAQGSGVLVWVISPGV
jgi:hypothetical protein